MTTYMHSMAKRKPLVKSFTCIGTVEVSIILNCSSQRFYKCTSIYPSSAGGQDFISVNELLMFGPGQQRRCVFITVLNDQECEDRPNEKFTVVIQGEDRRCVLRPNVLTITIDDLGQFDSVTDPDCCELHLSFVKWSRCIILS